MTEEELREKITWILLEWNAWSCEDRARYKFDYADQILTLIREAGWKGPEEPQQPYLGCATTRELLDEIKARIEVDGMLDYKTIDQEYNRYTVKGGDFGGGGSSGDW